MRFLTTEAKDTRKQKMIGIGLFGGIALLICGGLLTWVLSMGSVFRATYTRDTLRNDAVTDIGVGAYVPWGVLIMAIGALSAVTAVVYGLMQVKGQNSGPRRIIPNCRIVARFAADKTGVLYTEPGQIEFIDNLKFCVRMVSQMEGSVEYECSEEVFWSCGEGMVGDAEFQGKWIGAFRPYAEQPINIQR